MTQVAQSQESTEKVMLPKKEWRKILIKNAKKELKRTQHRNPQFISNARNENIKTIANAGKPNWGSAKISQLKK